MNELNGSALTYNGTEKLGETGKKRAPILPTVHLPQMTASYLFLCWRRDAAFGQVLFKFPHEFKVLFG